MNTTLSNTTQAQRARLLSALRESPKSTIELRRDQDIMMPAARIKELREMGHDIVTYRKREATEYGALHCVALYVLVKEAV